MIWGGKNMKLTFMTCEFEQLNHHPKLSFLDINPKHINNPPLSSKLKPEHADIREICSQSLRICQDFSPAGGLIIAVPLPNMVLCIYCEAYVVVLGWDIRINIWGVVAIVTTVPDFTWLSRRFKVWIPLTWVASKSFHTAQVLIQLEKKAEVQACIFF